MRPAFVGLILAAPLWCAAGPLEVARERLHDQTTAAISLCHVKAQIYFLERSPNSQNEAAACASEESLASAMQTYAELAASGTPAAQAALKDYVSAWRAAMKASPMSGGNRTLQRTTRDRLGELWEKFAIE